MYHVSAQGIDERMINVHYYYYQPTALPLGQSGSLMSITFFFFLVALHPQRRDGLLGTGTEWEGDDRVKA